MGEEMFRAAFLRSVLEALERLSGGQAESQLRLRLPADLQRSLTSRILDPQSAETLVSLDEAEDLLLGIDAALGDGSGSVLESVGQELATRSYLLREGVLSSGSVRQCIGRLGDMFLYPFEDAETQLELVRTDTGFNLALGVKGRPRATRILRHLTTGCIRASFTFALEATSTELKLFAHTVGDRAEISARYRQASTAEDITPPPSSRGRLRPVRPSSAPSAAQEVERILNGGRKSSFESPAFSGYASQGLDLIEKIPGPPRVPSIAVPRRK